MDPLQTKFNYSNIRIIIQMCTMIFWLCIVAIELFIPEVSTDKTHWVQDENIYKPN